MARRIEIINFCVYNPPHKAVNVEVRNGAPLKWVRLAVKWYRDPDVLDLPREERALWPAILGLAGDNRPPGSFLMTATQLAREIDLTEKQVRHALHHLSSRRKIRYVIQEVAA